MDTLRQQIDDIDKELQNLLKKRYNIARQIGEEKKRRHLPVHVPEREKEILDKIACEDKTLEWAVRQSYSAIFRISKNLQQKENLVFISGMPGSGKTTLGRAFARRHNLPFWDLDELIEERFGPISEIFRLEGEAGFRKKERDMLLSLEGERGIGALGGGSLLSADNRTFLENYWVLYLERPLDRIARDIHWDSRPLLREKQEALKKLWQERREIYENHYDFIVKNNGTIEESLKKMEEELPFMIK